MMMYLFNSSIKAENAEYPIFPNKEYSLSLKPNSDAVYFITREGITVSKERKKQVPSNEPSLEFNLVRYFTATTIAISGPMMTDSIFVRLTY